MTRYLSILLLGLAFSTPALAVHENNRPQVLIGGMGMVQGYNAFEYQMPISYNGAIAIGFFNGDPANLAYTDATGYGVAYKGYFLPGKATFYKMGINYVVETGTGNSSYTPTLSMGLDLTDPSGPLALSAELGLANAGGSMLEINMGLRF